MEEGSLAQLSEMTPRFLQDWPAREAIPSATVRKIVNQETAFGTTGFKSVHSSIAAAQGTSSQDQVTATELCLGIGVQSLVTTSTLSLDIPEAVNWILDCYCGTAHISSVMLEKNSQKQQDSGFPPQVCLPNLMLMHPIGGT